MDFVIDLMWSIISILTSTTWFCDGIFSDFEVRDIKMGCPKRVQRLGTHGNHEAQFKLFFSV